MNWSLCSATMARLHEHRNLCVLGEEKVGEPEDFEERNTGISVKRLPPLLAAPPGLKASS